jgi:drug/metabolite transporter (DMT)-like permease
MLFKENTFLYFYAAASFFYFADILQKNTSKNRWTWGYLTVRSLYTFILALTATLLITGITTFPDPANLVLMAGCSVICGGGLFFYIKAVNSLNFANVGSLYIIGTVFQQVIGVVILDEDFFLSDIPAMLLMSFGCVYQLLTSSDRRGAAAVLASSFCWTTGYILLSFPLKTANIYWSMTIMEASILFVCMAVTLRHQKKHIADIQSLNTPRLVWKFMLIGILISAGSYFNNMTFSKIPVSIISFLQLSAMPVAFLLSMRIFREKLNRVEWISFVTAFVGFAIYLLGRHPV